MRATLTAQLQRANLRPTSESYWNATSAKLRSLRLCN